MQRNQDTLTLAAALRLLSRRQQTISRTTVMAMACGKCPASGGSKDDKEREGRKEIS
jgi:hypothetical protein